MIVRTKKQKKTPNELSLRQKLALEARKSKLSPRREFRRQFIADENAPAHLLDKHEVCAVVNLSYPTIWEMMRANTFPRSRVVRSKVYWLSSDIRDWFDQLPRRRLKGDPDSSAALTEVS
jgi:predicted DNA-binding transcriptional regulator AlpA